MKNSKKVLTAMFVLLIMAFMAGCSNGNSSSYEPNEPINGGDANYVYESEPALQSTQYPSDVYFTFENIEDRAALTDVHEIDFRALYVRAMSEDSDYDISVWEESLAWLDERRGLLISTNTPVRYFEIFGITPTYDEHTGQHTLNATPIFYRHDEFLPEQPLFMNMFFITGGLLPSRGISFTDPSGARFSFALVDDRKDGGDAPFFLQEFRDGEIINGDTTPNFGLMNQNQIYRALDGDSVIIHPEEGGTITIVDKMDLVWAFMGYMPFEDMEIFNDSNISDSEFFARLSNEHFFGGVDVPVSALVDVGVLTSDEFHYIARLQIQGNLYAAFNNRHEGYQFEIPVDTTNPLQGETSVVMTWEGVDFTGYWQSFPSVGSGYDDRYAFNADGTFIFLTSQMDDITRERGFSGVWERSDSQVTLTIKNEIIIVDETVIYIAHAEEDYRLKHYEISDVFISIDTGYTPPLQTHTVWINGRQFWDFSQQYDMFDFYFTVRDSFLHTFDLVP